jgi:hypothetical protein
VASFGAEYVRDRPHPTDFKTASQWLNQSEKEGIDPKSMISECDFYVLAVHKKLAAQGRRPPERLAFHNGNITDLLHCMKRTV